MLGFSKATQFYKDKCEFGPCPTKGIPFAMSGFKCSGRETHIIDCPQLLMIVQYLLLAEPVSGVTGGNTDDIVAVECS